MKSLLIALTLLTLASSAQAMCIPVHHYLKECSGPEPPAWCNEYDPMYEFRGALKRGEISESIGWLYVGIRDNVTKYVK